MSDTPRTDAFDRSFNLPDGSRPKDSGTIPYLESGAYQCALRFAARLERESAAKDATIARLRLALEFYVSMCGNTCAAVDRQTALEMYESARAALVGTP